MSTTDNVTQNKHQRTMPAHPDTPRQGDDVTVRFPKLNPAAKAAVTAGTSITILDRLSRFACRQCRIDGNNIGSHGDVLIRRTNRTNRTNSN